MPQAPPIPRKRGMAGRYHQLLWPESCPVSSHTNQELSGEVRLETAPKPSQARGAFRPARRRSYPEGYGCYCADQNAVAFPGGSTPAQRPSSLARAGRAKEAGLRGVSGPGKARQPPQWGGVKNASPRCKSECNLRVKRSDP